MSAPGASNPHRASSLGYRFSYGSRDAFSHGCRRCSGHRTARAFDPREPVGSSVVVVVAVAVAVFVGLVGSACNDPGPSHVELCTYSSPGGATHVSDEKVTLPKGNAVVVKIVPVRSDDEYMNDETSVKASAEDDSLLGVNRVSPDLSASHCAGPSEVPWFFVLYGKSAGETALTVTVNGEAMPPIVVEVF